MSTTNSYAAGDRPIQTNICIQISGKDLSAPNGGVVKGMVVAPDWMRGDDVAVRLMNEAEGVATFRQNRTPAENRKFFDKSRPTIQKLMTGFRVGKNEIEPMREGGYLMVYGATKDMEASVRGEPTVWKGQYAENYGNDASREVMHGYGRVIVHEGSEGRGPYANLDLLFPRQAVPIATIEDYRNFFEECMPGQFNGVEHRAQAVIRMIVNDEVKSAWVQSARQKVTMPGKEAVPATENSAEIPATAPYDVFISASAEKTWSQAVREGRQSGGLLKVLAAALTNDHSGLSAENAELAKEIGQQLEAGTLKLEAIPGRQIPIIGSALDDVLDDTKKMYREVEKCLVKVGEDEFEPGFVKMTVGVLVRPAKSEGLVDTMIIAKFAADEFAKARSVDKLPTAGFTPVFTRERDAAAEAEAAQAASAGGTPQSSLDEPENDISDAEVKREEEYSPAP